MNKKVVLSVFISILIFVPLVLFIISNSSGKTREDIVITPSPDASEDEFTDGEPGMIKGAPPEPSIEQLQPRKSTYTEVLELLGNPTRIVKKDGYAIIYYRLRGSDRENKVYIKNDLVDYTIEQILIDNEIYKDFLVENGKKKPNGVIYNLYDNNAGFDLFVFSQQGIAFLANEPSGYAAEIHRFAPIDYQNYFTTLAPTLTFE